MAKRPLVLIADDDPDTRDLVRTVVEEFLECETILATSGAEVVPQALAHRPALILLDLSLPDLDGFEVAAELRRHPALAATAIIAITGLTSATEIRRAQEAGCDDVIGKPFDITALEARARQALRT